ncbi:hypothetical protein KIN20_031226 [Parelaphostrongylus tenuis]|uniref:Uncharacterized protein n=1 Tax=Parelaphostrongylus tenuis TaxID=148309 RepID=A0AAD5WGV5_PARTN|nr:hypothetical protein KIN20_031226 [Parelaphostrongylus tenuis]
MSSEKQGWLSSVSRLFSGGQQYTGRLVGQKSGDTQHSSNSDSTSSHQNFTSVNGGYPLSAVAESSSKPSRNLRYLSPSALDDKSSLSCSTTRKRILTQDDRPSTAIDLLLTQVNPKRSKTDQFASSMLENLSPRLFTEHLDSRMSRTVSGLSSASDFLHSPVSNRSLIERIGSNRSNASSLSSKTRAILNHLERINTPAREARKLPVMRGPTLPPERWAPLNPASPGVPPLLKRNLNVPSRIQLLSVSMASQRKPYWRDITRNVKEKETSTCPKEDGGKSGSISVHPLFDMDSADSIRACSNKSSKSRQQNVGSDLTTRNGHSSEELTELTKKSVGNGHTNVFNADKLLDEEVESEIPVFAPPPRQLHQNFGTTWFLILTLQWYLS